MGLLTESMIEKIAELQALDEVDGVVVVIRKSNAYTVSASNMTGIQLLRAAKGLIDESLSTDPFQAELNRQAAVIDKQSQLLSSVSSVAEQAKSEGL